MRIQVVLSFLLMALTLQASTPELGKDKLRRLVKLPGIAFQADWTFDPERGFTIGLPHEDLSPQIDNLRKDLKGDVSDAQRYYQLGRLYSESGDYTSAEESWAKAVELYRKTIEQQSDNSEFLLEFGKSLNNIGRREEAESVLRRATRVGSTDWKCWVTLGRFLDAQARSELTESSRNIRKRTASESFKPSYNKVSHSQRCLDEAAGCFEKAVTIAPDEADVYFRRAMHHSLENYVLSEIQRFTGAQQDNSDPLTKCFTQKSLSDLQRSRDLSPKDPKRILGVVLFEMYMAKDGKIKRDDESAWSSLPDKTQLSIRDAMTRLENMAQDPDEHVVAGALEALGILQGPILRDYCCSVSSLQRAVSLDPNRDQAWETLSSMLIKSQNYPELLTVCQDRLKFKDTAHTRMLLAKACEKMKLWTDAEEHTLAAVKDSPNDYGATLSIAALLLRRMQDANVSAEVNGWLGRAESLLNTMPEQQKSRQQVIELALDRTIFFALNDDLQTARKWVNMVKEKDNDNDIAQEIIAAMQY
ncbi:tetratricopeptide repeat protein [Pedosphaera parvula]|uniref:Tetratricopeptide TPR_2 repeat protein n=1 Tax=Pedosphaera parvula (strain Ellin514) TaxID=320771 RepID=B9XPZ4_PEDPL|nr:tetratricopeptide repeat protein [Pedosphaera parvula]EEF58091.1 Tetratricopeptide TPR_2 repeat protein [Pedosphaera parvula Ellin514]